MADNLHVPIVLKSGNLNLWKPQGPSMPVQGLLYLHLLAFNRCFLDVSSIYLVTFVQLIMLLYPKFSFMPTEKLCKNSSLHFSVCEHFIQRSVLIFFLTFYLKNLKFSFACRQEVCRRNVRAK